MTAIGPSSQGAPTTPEDATVPTAPAASPSPAIERANRMSAANMLRSLLPLVVICLVIVGWTALRQNPDDPVREIDPSSTVQLAAARADYPVEVPTGLSGDYRPTSARTDAGDAEAGDPVTLQIGYVTPSQEFAGFVIGDDETAAPLEAVLGDATQRGDVEIAGRTWSRSTAANGETALSREADGVTVVVSGSASDRELETVAAAVRPYAG